MQHSLGEYSLLEGPPPLCDRRGLYPGAEKGVQAHLVSDGGFNDQGRGILSSENTVCQKGIAGEEATTLGVSLHIQQ